MEKNKEIEKLTTVNKYLIDVIVDLKRKMEAFEHKSEKRNKILLISLKITFQTLINNEFI